MKLIGLIGGLGPAAAVWCYQALVDEADRRGVELRLLMAHAQVRRVLAWAAAGEREALAEHLLSLVDELRGGGAEVFAVPALTPHLAAPALRAVLGASFVDIIDVVNGALDNAGRPKALLLGTRAVVESGLYGRLVAETPALTEAELGRIHDLYVAIVTARAATAEVEAGLAALAQELTGRYRTQSTVLAGTELSLLSPSTWGPTPTIDAARLHVSAILDAAMAN